MTYSLTLIALCTILLVLVVVFLFYVALLFSALSSAPYVASTDARVRLMLDLVDVQPGETFVDIGSGDGRIVRKAAERGARSVGIEINPMLVMWSRWRARRVPEVTFRRANMWNESMEEFDVVSLYILPKAMTKLESKLKRELHPGARVVSNAFTFPNWEPTIEQDHIRVYTV